MIREVDDELRMSAVGCVTSHTTHVYVELSRRAALLSPATYSPENTFFATLGIVTRPNRARRWPSHDYYFYTSGVSFSPSFERGMIVKISHRNEEHNYTGREEETTRRIHSDGEILFLEWAKEN